MRPSMERMGGGLGMGMTSGRPLPFADYSLAAAFKVNLYRQTRTRYNQLIYSQDMSNAIWTKTNSGTGSAAPVVTADYALAPDGTMTADRVQFNSGTQNGGNSTIAQAVATVGNTVYSFYARTNDGTTISTPYWGNNAVSAPITVTPVWQRYVFAMPGAKTTVNIQLPNTTGVATSGDLLIWGLQVEADPGTGKASAYIPTVATAVSVTENFYTNSPVRANLAFYSDTIGSTGWTNSSVSYTAAAGPSTIVPTASTIAATATAASTQTSVNSGVTTPYIGGQTYTVSVYAKAGSGNLGYIQINNFGASEAFFVTFDVAAVTVGTPALLVGTGFTNISASIVADSGGFYRVAVSFKAPLAAAAFSYFLGPCDAHNSRSVTSGKSITLAHIKIEAGAVATAPIATTTAIALAGGIADLYGFTYTRSGVKGEVWSDGSITYHPAGVPAIGIDGYISRPSMTNLLIRSQEFDNSGWTKSSASVSANALASPDGSISADTITSTAAAASYIYQSTTTAAGAAVTSIFAKAGTCQFLQICDDHIGNITSYCNFDLVNGTVGTSLGTAGTITAIGGGWYRCSVTFTAVAQSATTYVLMAPSASSTRGPAVALGVTLHLWQAQLVADTQPGPIILTTSAIAATGGDALSTGITMPDEDGLVIAVARLDVVALANKYLLALSAGIVGAGVQFTTDASGALKCLIYSDAGVLQYFVSSVGSPLIGRVKVGLRRRAGKYTLVSCSSSNVVSLATESGATVKPSINLLSIGHASGASQIGGKIEAILYKAGTFSDADISSMLQAA